MAGAAVFLMPVAEAMSESGPPAETVLLPQQFRMPHFETGSFLQRRRDLYANIANARRSEPPDEEGNRYQGVAEIRALLDLAEFDLAHGLAAEGRDVLAGLTPGLVRAHELKRASLEVGLAAIDTRDIPLSEGAEALLDPKYDLWRDQAVLVLLHHWKKGEIEEAGKYVDVAAKRLYQYSRPFVRKALPAMLDTAVETRQWAAARRLAGRFALDPELAESSNYLFQLARTAEAGGDYLTAFDNYLKAGQGNDLWAHRARMGLIQLGMNTGTLPLPDALTLLEQASRDWTGDAWGVAVLKQLADINLQLGDGLGALKVLSNIMSRYPDTPDAQLARQQARSLWTDFYARGAAGKLSLSDFLTGHRRISEGYRFEPGFDLQTEALADRFMSLGATMVAADEYRETHDFLLVARDLGLVETDDRRLDMLRLKQADALYRGGQLDELAYILAEGLRGEEADLQDRLNLLRAGLHAERGEAADVVDTEVAEPTLHYLRLRAAAHFGRGDWEEAKRLYAIILGRAGKDATYSDAVRLLLSAHRSGDSETAIEVARRFQEVTQRPDWARIANSLTEEAPDLLPLRAVTAQQRVDTAEKTLENLRNLKSSGN